MSRTSCFRDVRSRLAHILLELGEDLGRQEGDSTVLQIEFTQAELATLVGSTRQTVNPQLRELELEGVLGRKERRIVILRPEALREIARDRDAS